MINYDEINKIVHRNLIYYFILWAIIFLFPFGIDYFVYNEFKFLYFINLSLIVLFPIINNTTPLPHNILFRKDIYLNELGIVGIIIISAIPFMLYFGSPLILYSILLNFSLAFFFTAILEVKIYNYFQSKYDLDRDRYLIVYPCPRCKTYNFYTYNRKKELFKRDFNCSKCGNDYTTELYETIFSNDDLRKLKKMGKYDKEVKRGL